MHWYLKVLEQYADFNGRARRKEYWMFTLFHIIFAIIAAILDSLISLPIGDSINSLITGLYLVAILIPSLAVSVRRLHDIGISGWMILVALIPIAGIGLLVLFVLDSDPGENQYGANPKEVKV